jgi:hypothetical protein
MAHPLLDRAERGARCRHLRPESVAQLMERDTTQLRPLERGVEAFPQFRSVVRAARVRMAEDEVVVGPPRRCLEVAVELTG